MDYTPFNSWKALLHKEELEAIYNGNFLPPYWCCVDPTNRCNHNCLYCNAKDYRTDWDRLEEEHLMKIAGFIKDWGIKSVIVEGGGEPLLNSHTPAFIRKCKLYDIEVGIITNGSLIDDSISINLIENVRFCGISFDAATRETYMKIRGDNNFDRTIKRIEILNNKRIQQNSNIDVNMKFLINSINYAEIEDFAKLARNIGCSGVHFKPIAVDNLPWVDKNLEITKEQMVYVNHSLQEVAKMQSDNFNVHIVLYKFDTNFRRTVRFEKCECTPLGGVFGADGNFWLCFNMRGAEGFRLCSHRPDPYEVKRMWGSKYHKQLIDQINADKCMRCGLTQYNEIMEKAIKKDNMFKNFP